MGITIIGIDCAVEDKNVGLALAFFDEDKLEARIKDVRIGDREGSMQEWMLLIFRMNN